MSNIDWVKSYGRARRVAWEKICGARRGTGGWSLPYGDARHGQHARIMAKLITGIRKAIIRAGGAK